MNLPKIFLPCSQITSIGPVAIDDQPCAAAIGEVGKRPLNDHQQAVAESGEVVELEDLDEAGPSPAQSLEGTQDLEEEDA